MNLTDKITITNEDCMELLKRTPDNYYSLAICDPPYGINADLTQNDLGSKKGFTKNAGTYKKYHQTNWDNEVPTDEYFAEIKINGTKAFRTKRKIFLKIFLFIQTK